MPNVALIEWLVDSDLTFKKGRFMFVKKDIIKNLKE